MSIIYKIFCKDENIKECYIGSTNNLTKRKYSHKSSYNNSNRHHLKVYKFMRSNGGWENFDFMILEQFETIINKNDLFKIEGQYIKNNNATLNSIIAGRTDKEWREDNKTILSEYHKTYTEENRKKTAEYKSQYYEQNKKQILEKLKEKIECIYCKSLIRKGAIKQHQRSNKCLKVQNTNQI